MQLSLSPYLLFNGECEAALNFYEKCGVGKIDGLMKHAGTPAEEHVPAEMRDKILHGRLLVGDGVLMASDSPPDRYQRPAGFSVSLQLKDVAVGEKLFNALSEGGTVHMPFGETFWAAGFAMFADKFGIPWMINCERPH
jgi:PhnB protein